MIKSLFNKQTIRIFIRTGLFVLILIAGTIIALSLDETASLALTDLNNLPVQTVTTTPNSDALYAVFDRATGSQLYRSDDRGRTWEPVNKKLEMDLSTLTIDPANENRLYAGTVGGPLETIHSLWFSDDGGRRWTPFPLNLPASPERQIPAVTVVTAAPDEPGVLYVGTEGQGVYRVDLTVDRLGYETVGDISLYNTHVENLIVGPERRIYALTGQGLFVTQGDTWQKLESVPETPVSLVAVPGDPQTIYAGSASTGVYRSTDGGQTWQSLNQGLGLIPGAALRVTALAVAEDNPEHVVAATAYGLGKALAPGGLYESYRSGQSWRKVAALDSIVTKLTLKEDAIYAVTTNGLQRYGAPLDAEPAISAGFSFLVHPTGTQWLILSLTICLAGLVLLGRAEWLGAWVQRRKNQ